MSMTMMTIHGFRFGLEMTGWNSDAGRETAAMTLMVELQELGPDSVSALHQAMTAGSYEDHPELARQIENLARDRALDACHQLTSSACSVGLFPARSNGGASGTPVTLH